MLSFSGRYRGHTTTFPSLSLWVLGLHERNGRSLTGKSIFSPSPKESTILSQSSGNLQFSKSGLSKRTATFSLLVSPFHQKSSEMHHGEKESMLAAYFLTSVDPGSRMPKNPLHPESHPLTVLGFQKP